MFTFNLLLYLISCFNFGLAAGHVYRGTGGMAWFWGVCFVLWTLVAIKYYREWCKDFQKWIHQQNT